MQGVCKKEDESNQTAFPVVAGQAKQKDAFGVSKVRTRSSTSQEAGFELGLPNFDNISLAPTLRVQDFGSPTVASEFSNNQLTQGEEDPAQVSTGESRNEVSNKSNMKLVNLVLRILILRKVLTLLSTFSKTLQLRVG
jgi:hypothetical protein